MLTEEGLEWGRSMRCFATVLLGEGLWFEKSFFYRSLRHFRVSREKFIQYVVSQALTTNFFSRCMSGKLLRCEDSHGQSRLATIYIIE